MQADEISVTSKSSALSPSSAVPTFRRTYCLSIIVSNTTRKFNPSTCKNFLKQVWDDFKTLVTFMVNEKAIKRTDLSNFCEFMFISGIFILERRYTVQFGHNTTLQYY